MLASTTQEAPKENSTDLQKEWHTDDTFSSSTTTVDKDKDDVYGYMEQQYGALWGTFRFEDALGDYSIEPRKFLYVDGNVDLSILCEFIFKEWELQTPNIVIPILSSITRHKPFKSIKMIETLKNGFKNAANATEVWFITNGLDAGVPQLIGNAFRDEILLRQADDAWAIKSTGARKKRKKLTLIGIVCDDEVKDIFGDKIINKAEIKVPLRKREHMSLNSDHTHFIIIREKPIGSSSLHNTDKELVANESDAKPLEKLTDSATNATNKFRDSFESFLHQDTTQVNTSSATTDSATATSKPKNPWNEDGFPMVCVLARGTPGTIELINRKVEQEVPIVVLKGTGLAADIIAFTHEEFGARNEKENEESYLKVELARRLLDEYSALKENNVKRNEIRNYILSIVRKSDQGKRKFLSFVDINSATSSLNDFHKFILLALLQSQKTATGNKVNTQLKRNLLLTLDWNLPDLALSEIFQRDDDMKYSVPAELFDKAVLGKKLEVFVDLFLDRDFILHRYLKSEKLVSLFNQAKDRDFLTTTSLEGILGLTGEEEGMPENFVERGLNIIVKRLTGISHFFSKHEMDCNAMGIYFGDKSDKGIQRQRMRAEKKALRHLVIYSVLMNRGLLAKILWKRSSEPIPLALICYMMFKQLAPYCHEMYQRTLTEKQAKEFSDCAVGVLDKAFNEDSSRAGEMLDEKHMDWNQMTTVELAYNADNKEFMSHPACQKWVTRQFYGEITPRELPWGFFKFPDYLKIILSALLIFPMWFWINFSPIGQASTPPPPPPPPKDSSKDKESKEDQSPQSATDIRIQQGGNCFQWLRRRLFGGSSKTSSSAENSSSDAKEMSIFEEIEVLWSAPITKFYINFVSYMVYLLIFTLAVMWPSCGNLFLDCLVWFWTASITFENTRVAYEKYCSQSSLPLGRAVFEVIVQTTFLALYLGVRIIGLWNFGTCQIMPAKAILSVGLIYYYYRILFIFLPISPTLGPMMIRLRCMIMDDFFTFLQLFVIFMISYGVAITAVLYPHHPLNLDLFSKAFVFRGLMALFSSEMADLKSQHQSCTINATSPSEKDYACLRLSHGLSFDYSDVSAYKRYGIASPKCNQTSWIAWFLLIQYFFLAKRFLTSLLTAMFGLTGARVQSQSQQIWMYNRYEIVMEYAKRPRLPPPFVVMSYIAMFIANSCGYITVRMRDYAAKKNARRRQARQRQASEGHTDGDQHADRHDDNDDTEIVQERSMIGRLLTCQPCQQITERQENKILIDKRNSEDSEANIYWKHKAKEYYAKTQEADKVQEKLDNLSNNVTNVVKDMDVQRKSLRLINDRVVTLEKIMIDSQILLEKIRSTLQQEDKVLPESEKFIHMLSRESPYIYTNLPRFPVTERHIPWRVLYDTYDPTVLSLPKEHVCFQDSERSFVEPDFLQSTSEYDSKSESTPDKGELTPTPYVQSNLFGSMESPMTTLSINTNIPISEYKWNAIIELQLPNENKKIIIDRTTWIGSSKDKSQLLYQLDRQLSVPLNPMGRTGVRGRGALIRWGPNKSIMAIVTRWKKYRGQFAVVDGQRILEALVFKDKTTNDWKFAGGKILGIESPYGAICRSFHKLAFNDDDSEHSLAFQENDMIEHFESFARSPTDVIAANGFESHMVYKGYIDDLRNTDNAWVESEIWNFHYGDSVAFPDLRVDGMALWKDVTNNSRGFLIQTSILREVARVHDAYFE